MMNKNKIKILIADDHALVRMGCRDLLEGEADIVVTGEAKNGIEVLQQAAKNPPDLVIMDLMMPQKDGIETTKELKKSRPGVKILILTSITVSDSIASALEAGADGVILKNSENEELIAAARIINESGRYISDEVNRLLSEDPPAPKLSPRQQEVLSSLIRGLTDEDIARQLGIAQTSVRTHIEGLFAKVGAGNRSEAIAIALRKQLVKF